MQKLLFLLSLLFVITACNDGDVLEVQLEFDDSLESCDLSNTEYLIYNTRLNPFETISLIFPRNAVNDLIFSPNETPYLANLNINGNSIKFNYRTYDGNPNNLICTLLPDPITNITNDYSASSGQIITETTYIDNLTNNTRTYTTNFKVLNVSLTILSTDVLELGNYTRIVPL